jgi:hypothetical protein
MCTGGGSRSFESWRLPDFCKDESFAITPTKSAKSRYFGLPLLARSDPFSPRCVKVCTAGHGRYSSVWMRVCEGSD